MSQINESATVAKSKNFCELNQTCVHCIPLLKPMKNSWSWFTGSTSVRVRFECGVGAQPSTIVVPQADTVRESERARDMTCQWIAVHDAGYASEGTTKTLL